jgi:glycosyltransferase involved in cell wall biosynthesis
LTARGERLHVLVVGLSLPLESYVVARLQGLARRGLRVTAAVVDGAGLRLRGVEILDQPHWNESTPRLLFALFPSAVRLGVRDPRLLLGVICAARRAARSTPRSRPLAFASRLRSFIPLAAVNPDVVHFEWNSAAMRYQLLADVWGCPTVVSCHGSEVNVRPHLPGGHAWTRSLQASLSAASAVHCVSGALAAEVAGLGVEVRRCWLIHNGVEPREFSPAEATSSGLSSAPELRIISIGELRWLKGHEYALHAVHELIESGVPATLDLVGPEPDPALAERSERRRLQAVIERLKLGDHVRLHPRLRFAEVRDLLRTSDVLLHMSLSEGLSVAVLEAMACALPVVVADAGGLTEAVTDGIHGFVVPLRSPTVAADALRRLHNDPILRQRLGTAARDRVLDRFTLEHQLRQFHELYRRVTGAEPTNPSPPALPPPSEGPLRTRVDGPLVRILICGRWDSTLTNDATMTTVRQLVDRNVNCHCRIVGRGPCRDALWLQRHQLGLERFVEIVEGNASAADRAWADYVLEPDAVTGSVRETLSAQLV